MHHFHKRRYAIGTCCYRFCRLCHTVDPNCRDNNFYILVLNKTKYSNLKINCKWMLEQVGDLEMKTN